MQVRPGSDEAARDDGGQHLVIGAHRFGGIARRATNSCASARVRLTVNAAPPNIHLHVAAICVNAE